MYCSFCLQIERVKGILNIQVYHSTLNPSAPHQNVYLYVADSQNKKHIAVHYLSVYCVAKFKISVS